jgi:hypothetical protein
MSKIITSALACLLAAAVPTLALADGHRPLQRDQTVLLPADQVKAVLTQCSRPTPAGIDGSWTVTAAALKGLERDLPGLANRGPQATDGKAFDPSGFYRQYVGVTVKGQRFIYINAFRGSDDYIPFDIPWRQQPVVICDGGSSYWGALYDPQTHRFSDLAFNGMI